MFCLEYVALLSLIKAHEPPGNYVLDFNILARLASFTTGWDEQTKTAYAFSSSGFVSYDDELAICYKTEYAMDNQLNGFIIWEISGDLLEDGSTPLLDAMNCRLKASDNPACCDSGAVVPTDSGGGGGIWVDGVNEGNPWYANPDGNYSFCGICIN
jgi:hypothetical protein